MAVLTIKVIDLLGGVSTAGAAAAGGGDSFPNTGNEFFQCANGSGVSITVTFLAQKQCVYGFYGIAASVHNLPFSVAAGITRIFGPFPPELFNDANGRVQVTYSAVTTVTVAALQGARA